ncbi:DUF1206 domain-containing protein [uncultured Microbacterium sp.]|uniref:DUF1206 domain-containing protein n=1 Tax=uncultured Microbacterium sp. TaxID=191216 RepID=A0A1Y5P6Z8_9MICO|nr:DUF1206 domain-containing protein [uncultured Microbacterium sp.]SBS73290.1 conserved membrane hypothetical protein [uncultured Microbacterium sp.]
MTTPKNAARAAKDSSVFRGLARVGYVVLGILHVVIGGIAISIATGGGGDADQGGAMTQIRSTPAGVVLLWVIALGLFALAAWQIAEAFLERDPDTKKKWGHRAKFIGTAVAYIAIAATALVFALGGRSESSDSSQTFSARLLAAPGGVFLLVVVGLGVAAIGIAFIVRGITRAFEKHLDLPSGAARRGIVGFGVAGYVAKGVAVAATGVLFVVAAVTHDPETAGGLDAGLRALAGLPFGAVVLWVVGAGLVLYGLFCVARARYNRM